jgi:hypothetical protein
VFASAEINQYVNIYLSYSLSNLKFNDEPVELDMKFVGEFATVFNDKIQDEDSLRDTNTRRIISRVRTKFKN